MSYYLMLLMIIQGLAEVYAEGVTSRPERRRCDGPSEFVYKCECLKFIITPQVKYETAVANCAAEGGQIVTIHEREKQQFVVKTLRKISDKNGVWLGMKRDVNDKFNWIDGKPVDGGYDSWGRGEPSTVIKKDCALLHNSHSWSWQDFYCSVESYSYICQYDMPCESEKETQKGLTTNEVVGIVVGGVIGLICFFAVLFLLINCCRDVITSKRHERPVVEVREMEIGGSSDDDVVSSLPMIAPPEKSSSNQFAGNDLGRSNEEKVPLAAAAANVVIATPAAKTMRQDSVKISNLAQENTTGDGDGDGRRRSNGSIDDNYLTVNADTDTPKEFSSSVAGIDKL